MCSRDEAILYRAPWRARRMESAAGYRDLYVVPAFPSYVAIPVFAGPSLSQVEPAPGTPVVDEPPSESHSTPPINVPQDKAQE